FETGLLSRHVKSEVARYDRFDKDLKSTRRRGNEFRTRQRLDQLSLLPVECRTLGDNIEERHARIPDQLEEQIGAFDCEDRIFVHVVGKRGLLAGCHGSVEAKAGHCRKSSNRDIRASAEMHCQDYGGMRNLK